MSAPSGPRELPEIREARTHIARSTLGLITGAGLVSAVALSLISPTARFRQIFLATSVAAAAWGLRKSTSRLGYRVAAGLFTLFMLVLFAGAAWTAGGLTAPAIHSFFLVVLLTSLLLGPRQGYVTAALVVLVTLGLALAEIRGWLPAAWVRHTPWSRAWLVGLYACLVAVFTGKALHTLEEALALAGDEIATRKAAERELEAVRDSLEVKVAERTEELARTVDALQRQAGELRAAKEAQSRFLALVSHELRTPLTSVRASLGLLAGRGDLPPEARSLADIADRNALRLLALTNELLDLEKMEAGLFEVRREPLEMKDPLARAVEGIQSLAQDRARAVVLALPEGPAWVQGDGPRIEQVCLNLLSNALKHAKGEGAVELRLECRAEGAWVGVSNPGDPVPEHFQGRIFHTFHQLEPEAGSSGLGLSLSKAIVEAHGGTIGFENRPSGVVFYFLLPWQER